MENILSVKFNMENGGIDAIYNENDPAHMNWAEGQCTWGTIQNAKFVCAEEIDCGIRAVYETERLLITATRTVADNKLKETYVLKNKTDADVFIPRGGVGIYATFNENYDLTEKCLQYKCHTHIWCGGEVSYVYARKMGLSDFALGMVLLEGSLDTYSTVREEPLFSNDRGDFIFHPTPFTLVAGEETVLSWELFFHGDGAFFEEFEKYPKGIIVTSDAYTVFTNETIAFEINRPNAIVTLDGRSIPVTTKDGKSYVTYKPERTREYIFALDCDGILTKAEFYVQIPFAELVKKRVEFIVKKQQYHNPKSPLDGAYLIYDNEEESVYFDNVCLEFCASNERLVMGLLVAKYLQYNKDDALYESLMKYYRFITREVYDEETGVVYNTIGKKPTHKRLYNAPWMAMFVLELYKLTKDKSYLSKMCKLLDVYYSVGGERFYPNGLTMLESIEALREAEMHTEADTLMEKFKHHINNIVEIGINYPPHEVQYEQTIVSPGAALTAQMGLLTSDRTLAEDCKLQIRMLERFNGDQPSFYLNQQAIRHWDAYWGGKRRVYGDTLPHSSSIHTSNAFLQYARLSGNEEYKRRAYRGMRNILCYFKEDGRASTSYVYPFTCNGIRGEFYEPFANDQDGVLYFMIKNFHLLDDVEGTR